MHPSISLPYLSNTLTNMAQHACDTVHREKKSLWAVKNMLTRFRGDNAFIPCGTLNTAIDDVVFHIRPIYKKLCTAKLYLRNDHYFPISLSNEMTARGSSRAHIASRNHDQVAEALHRSHGPERDDDTANRKEDTRDHALDVLTTEPQTADVAPKEAKGVAITPKFCQDDDQRGTAIEGTDADDLVLHTAPASNATLTANGEAADDSNASLTNNLQENAEPQARVSRSGSLNQIQQADTANQRSGPLPSPESLKNEEYVDMNSITHESLGPERDVSADGVRVEAADSAAAEDGEDEAQPAPRRMRTRAQAQASEKSNSSRARTPSAGLQSPPNIHPLYLMSEHARPDRDLGLPSQEADETRRLLVAYVQKQEEVVRGAEMMYTGLLRADRMRRTVFRWCKAEGHLGEMSDGEDWYDKEEWGLDEDLKKGHDDEEEDNVNPGKKTRKTRQQ